MAVIFLHHRIPKMWSGPTAPAAVETGNHSTTNIQQERTKRTLCDSAKTFWAVLELINSSSLWSYLSLLTTLLSLSLISVCVCNIFL